MKRLLVSILLVCIMNTPDATAAEIGSAARVAANAPVIRYEGRYATDAAGGVRLGFPGVTAHLRFRGSSLALRATASTSDVWFDVAIDDAPPTKLHLREGDGNYPLLSGKTIGEHRLRLVRRTESWQGECTLHGFELGAGSEFLSAEPAPARRLMFIGDSVTCGEMTAWTPTGPAKSAENSSAALSYGMIVARRLGAECHLVSYGGRGIIRDWQGIRDTRNAPQFYELALPDDPKAKWDHHRYVPDAIGIQLGTNDFNQGVPDQNEFVNAYVEFVRKVRRDAPNAAIFLMDSPIVSDDAIKGPRRTALHGYLEQIVRRLDDGKVHLLPLRNYPGVPGNGHPTGAEHEAMADKIEPVFRAALGWR
jgi:hypothetical protein